MREIQIAKTGDIIRSTYSHHGHLLTVERVWKSSVTTECGTTIKHGNYTIHHSTPSTIGGNNEQTIRNWLFQR